MSRPKRSPMAPRLERKTELMSNALDFDSIGLDRLREIGSVKWSMFPDRIGAFVAEPDR